MNYWLLAAIGAPFLWAISNLTDKVIRTNFIKSDLALTCWVSFAKLPIVAILFLFVDFDQLKLIPSLFTIAAGLIWTLGFFTYFKAIDKEETTVVALLLQLVPVFTFILGFIILGETLSSNQIIGFLFIMAAGMLASINKLEGKWQLSKAFWLLILSTFIWALSDVYFKKYIGEFANFRTAFTLFMFGSFLASLPFVVIPKTFRQIKHHFSDIPKVAWSYLVISLLLGVSGSLLFAYALSIGKVSLTSVLIGIQPLFVAILAVVLRKAIRGLKAEDLSKKALALKGISFILIIFGLALIS